MKTNMIFIKKKTLSMKLLWISLFDQVIFTEGNLIHNKTINMSEKINYWESILVLNWVVFCL